MPAIQDVDQIMKKVEARLAEEEANGIPLKVASRKLDDDWLYVEIVPKQPGVRASDYARLMAQIERELRAQGDDQVLLLPAMED